MKKLIILRGCPGSGKSTFADFIFDTIGNGMSCCKYSADDFFIDKKTGKYKFDSNLLHKAHSQCRQYVKTSMELDYDNNLIIVDNTNTTKKEIQPYLDLAKAHDYEVTILTVGSYDTLSVNKYIKRNIHGVPPDKVRDMAHRIKENL